MKSFSVALLFCVYISFSLALPETRAQRKAYAECNATNPVQRDVIEQKRFTAYGNIKINLTRAEKCFVLCYFQKIKVLDQDGNIIIDAEFIKSIHRTEYYGDFMIASTFQMNRMFKDIPDKCEKAALIHNRIEKRVFELLVYQRLTEIIYDRDELANDEALQKVKPFLDKVNQTIVSAAREELEKINAGSS